MGADYLDDLRSGGVEEGGVYNLSQGIMRTPVRVKK